VSELAERVCELQEQADLREEEIMAGARASVEEVEVENTALNARVKALERELDNIIFAMRGVELRRRERGSSFEDVEEACSTACSTPRTSSDTLLSSDTTSRGSTPSMRSSQESSPETVQSSQESSSETVQCEDHGSLIPRSCPELDIGRCMISEGEGLVVPTDNETPCKQRRGVLSTRLQNAGSKLTGQANLRQAATKLVKQAAQQAQARSENSIPDSPRECLGRSCPHGAVFNTVQVREWSSAQMGWTAMPRQRMAARLSASLGNLCVPTCSPVETALKQDLANLTAVARLQHAQEA